MKVENGPVAPDLTINDIERLLAAGALRPVEVDEGVDGESSAQLAYSQLDHALQTAAVLREWAPNDEVMQVAGLIHDIGHLLGDIDDPRHAESGATAVRQALGERVAALVGLHVEAKRYLVAEEGRYGERLAADSVASLALQGGPMTPEERDSFMTSPFAADAVLLRRADESGKVDGLEVPGLGQWMAVVRRVAVREA
jgi:predicted HD phosphohydrolase